MYTKQRQSHYYTISRAEVGSSTNNIETFGRILAKLCIPIICERGHHRHRLAKEICTNFLRKTKICFFSYYYIQSFAVCRYENIKIIHSGCNDS